MSVMIAYLHCAECDGLTQLQFWNFRFIGHGTANRTDIAECPVCGFRHSPPPPARGFEPGVVGRLMAELFPFPEAASE